MKKPEHEQTMGSPLLSNDCGWACWVLENTDMPKNQVFKRAAQRFGVTASAVERIVLSTVGKDSLSERSERLIAKYKPKYAASNGAMARVCRDFDKHLRDLRGF